MLLYPLLAMSHLLSHVDPESLIERTSTPPFSEMIVSWNGKRPDEGTFEIFVSLFVDGVWSEKLLYATWGATSQGTFSQKGGVANSYQDAISPTGGLATGYRIYLEGTSREKLDALFVSLSTPDSHIEPPQEKPPSVFLSGFVEISQMGLGELGPRLCSPTSLTMVLSHFLPERAWDPLQIAQEVYDNQWDIYGNWILNTAAASHYLRGLSVFPRVERVGSFMRIHEELSRGFPLIVSVRGHLPGAPQEYRSGHLLVLTGYDAEKNGFQVMDPAFPETKNTSITYPVEDFLRAWKNRGYIAYVFSPT